MKIKQKREKYIENVKNKILKPLVLLSLLILFILVTSCSQPQVSISYNFKQGYDGLIITPLENSPPKEIYPDSKFKIILKMENKGAYELTQGKLSLLGFDDKYFTVTNNQQSFDMLEGRSLNAPTGGIIFLEFPVQAKKLFSGSEKYPAPYFIKADYHYKTEFAPTICINPKLYDVYSAGCKVNPKLSFNGQGSPLAVTQLETITSPGSPPAIEFRLTLKNNGRGKLQKATLERARIANEPLLCEFKGPSTNKVTFLFKENPQTEEQPEAILVCNKILNNQDSYSTALFFEFSFDYSLKEKKEITLIK